MGKLTKSEIEAFADFKDGDRVWISIIRGNTLIRRNGGMSALELMGISSLAQREIAEQLDGEYKPEKIQREVLVYKDSSEGGEE